MPGLFPDMSRLWPCWTPGREQQSTKIQHPASRALAVSLCGARDGAQRSPYILWCRENHAALWHYLAPASFEWLRSVQDLAWHHLRSKSCQRMESSWLAQHTSGCWTLSPLSLQPESSSWDCDHAPPCRGHTRQRRPQCQCSQGITAGWHPCAVETHLGTQPGQKVVTGSDTCQMRYWRLWVLSSHHPDGRANTYLNSRSIKMMGYLLKRWRFVDGMLKGMFQVLGVKAHPKTPSVLSVKFKLDTQSVGSVILAITSMFSILESSCLTASLRWIAYLWFGCTLASL